MSWRSFQQAPVSKRETGLGSGREISHREHTENGKRRNFHGEHGVHGVKESTVIGAGRAVDVKSLLWLLSSVGSTSVEH